MHTTHADIDLDLVVLDKAQVARGVCELGLGRADGSELPAWAPGAHVDLHVGGQVRQFSLCGDPADATRWATAVYREPDSRGGSAYVHERLRVGDVIAARGPRNNFGLLDAPAYEFVIGGIGVTPLLPMIAEVAARGADFRVTYGGRTRAAMAYAGRLESAYGDRVRLLPHDAHGLLPVDEIVAAAAERGAAVYCCGPEPLIGAVEEACAARGLGAQVERFAARADVTPADEGGYVVVAARSGKEIPIAKGQRIIDALAAAGIRVLTSCEEGLCGTCETVVLEGEPEHRDSLLTDAERAAGDTMFVCVSGSRGPRLVLDL